MNAELSQVIVNAVFSILLILVGLLVKTARQWLSKQAGETGAIVLEIVARNAVNAVEQIYKNENVHGKEKLGHAKSLALTALNQKGIKVTNEQLNLFLESAVKVMNDGINNHGNNDDKIVE